ncbi:uncharacterized protein LOC124921288 [Impatiens glandulifera]|uniref:uncharacterized protein LOC124921288 n=1 Tax=Impatiens glandulifera TaxID=253017 RepID=UPI001FB09D1E|nr:uncharacterized protein LOC124921288 [Impatiens glandulifera]
MSDPYERVKGGRLSFKGSGVASRSKSIDKKHKKKKKETAEEAFVPEFVPEEDVPVTDITVNVDASTAGEVGGDIYTIDAAKRMKYDQLFPVEAKKFGYQAKAKLKSVEEALDDRVKKKADRYCK